MTFHIKKNDTSPVLTATLQDDDGVAVDLTGATLKFIMTAFNEETPKVNIAAVIVSPALGTVSHAWLAAHTDTGGIYKGEWEVTYSDSSIETFPNNDTMTINVVDDLA